VSTRLLLGPAGQDRDSPLETILIEMDIEGKGMIKSMVANQSKTRAIHNAEVLVVVSDENLLRGLLNCLPHAQHADSGVVEVFYEIHSSTMGHSRADDGVGF